MYILMIIIQWSSNLTFESGVTMGNHVSWSPGLGHHGSPHDGHHGSHDGHHMKVTISPTVVSASPLGSSVFTMSRPSQQLLVVTVQCLCGGHCQVFHGAAIGLQQVSVCRGVDESWVRVPVHQRVDL